MFIFVSPKTGVTILAFASITVLLLPALFSLEGYISFIDRILNPSALDVEL